MMRCSRYLNLKLTTLMGLLVLVGVSGQTHAVNKVFNNGGGDGLWLTAGNWGPPGVPGAADTAFIIGGQIATVDAATNPVAAIHVGQGTQNGWLIVDTGTLESTGVLNVGHSVTANSLVGTYEQNGGTVTVADRFTVGAGSAVSTATVTDGTLTVTGGLNSLAMMVSTDSNSSGSGISQSGGTVNANTGQLRIGEVATGSYDLSGGGILNATGNQTIVGVGAGSTGSEFNQSDTSDFNAHSLIVGHASDGKYTISGGTADIANTLRVGATATATGAAAEQTGGTVTVNGSLEVGTGAAGSYTQSAGTLNANGLFGAGWSAPGTYTLSGTGILNGGSVIAGLASSGADGSLIDQQGGTLNATVLTAGRLGRGDYQISGGEAIVNHVKIADGVGAGLSNPEGSQVMQTGGKVDAANDILVGGTASGSYIISDGTLEFDGTIVVGNDGTFKVIGDTATITDTLDPGVQNGMAISDGTLEFEFGAAGVSVVDLGTSTFAIPEAQGPGIVVDGAAYTGSAGTIPLVTFDGFGGIGADMGWATETITGFAGFDASIVTTNSSVDLVLTATGSINGDYNDTGVVEQGDLDLVLLNWGATWPPEIAGWVNQQPTDDGLVDQNDLDGVLLNWGNSAAASAGVVPEPGAIGMLAVAVGTLALARRRRSRH